MPDVKPQADASASASAGSGASAPPDPLARLYHMSTTAGVGSQDYVAINPTAIAALLLGFASVLVVLNNLLLIIPLGGLICGIVAIHQIRHSNQTQTGTWLAVLGIFLSLALGAGKAALNASERFRTSGDERACAALLDELGHDVAAGNYQQAYDLFDDRFRQGVNLTTFQTAFNLPTLGRLRSAEWNHQQMQFEQQPDSPGRFGAGMALFYFGTNPQPSRMFVQFSKASDGPWRITNIPSLFPAQKGK